jgi:signal peptidase I
MRPPRSRPLRSPPAKTPGTLWWSRETLPLPTARAARRRPRWLRDILLGMFAVAILHAFVVQISVVRGHSMEPALIDGDRLVVDRVGPDLLGLSRFDVVVLGNPKNPVVDYVKRVVGLPGDQLALADGRLVINGVPVHEWFHPIADHAEFPPLTIPSGHVFVLGDNRPISLDSREFGLVPVALLRGVVRARFWPPSRIAAL